MTKAIISLNSGSSSIKFGLFIASPTLAHAAGGLLEGIGTAPRLTIRDEAGALIAERCWDEATLTHETLLEDLYHWADGHLPHHEIIAIGHRVVHGGTHFTAPTRVTGTVLATLDALSPLAPLHQPHNLAAIRAIAQIAPHLPQIACFDTAFHATAPALATRLPLPQSYAARGYRRYGFHGLSYEYIAGALAEADPALARGRVIAAHLGNGASLCAMLGGVSVDTTMGFTALDGLMMGTRTGALDPGVVVQLVEQEGLGGAALEDLLYRQSGLLGVSELSSDMRALHASDSPHAAEAIALFAWSAARHAASLMVATGGLDGIVFTAGIGEHDPLIRAMICEHLGWTGLRLDAAANAANAALISTPDSAITLRVIATDEERMIARHVSHMLPTIC